MDENEDRASIRAVALDCIEGWYAGDRARVERALHPQLAKRVVERDGRTLRRTSAAMMLDWTQAGRGGGTPTAERRAEVTILDVFERAASVKVQAQSWVDYLHMAKIDGRWIIVNVLWEPDPATLEGATAGATTPHAAESKDARVDWAQRLMTIAQAGLTYAVGGYDLERYRTLRELAAEVAAAATGAPFEAVQTTFEQERGYFTPKVDVRAVVFAPDGAVLLVRETADGLWSLPGGWADVGESLRENAVREVLEESGYRVRADKLLAVYDKAKHEHPAELVYAYKAFVRCELLGGEPTTSLETSEVGFFTPDRIPPLSTPRVNAAQLRRMFDHRDDPTLPTDFD